MKNILDLTLEELSDWMKTSGESAFRATQVNDWIYKKVYNFDEMKNITKTLQEKLKDNFYLGIHEVIEKYTSSDKKTVKYLFKLKDGNVIESVLMKYDYGNSVCLSTQVGCRMGCTFCASTIGGRVRNLSSGEILGEILTIIKDSGENISNIVLMGTGEPFDNYDNVLKFLAVVNSKKGLNIGQRHITLSTCGLVPEIRKFADENLQVTLAISLHSPMDDLRKEMMPIANKYSIEELINSCDYYIKKTNRRITFEYSLVKGKNDSKEHAIALANLLKNILCHVNLIPVNQVIEREHVRPSKETILAFKNILVKNNIETTVRKEMGLDINAACGQLRRTFIEKEG